MGGWTGIGKDRINWNGQIEQRELEPTKDNDLVTKKYVDDSVTATNVLTTRGDILIRDASNDNARLAVGANTEVLTSDGTDISWAAAGGAGLWEEDGANVKLSSVKHVDFQKYKAITMVCDNGTTLPGTPTAGQWYLHTPTGRKVLMQYDGTNWIPIMNVGATTIYVDGTDGTDSLDKGGAVDAGAFATIQYAIDSLAGVIGGNVVINVAAGTYSEDVVFQGKNFTGNFTITLEGTLTSEASASQDSSVQGTGATQGSITDTGAFAAYANYLLYSSNNAEYRIIDSVTADKATICGTWSAAPTGTYTVYSWGTNIDPTGTGITIAPVQAGIVINNIHVTTNAVNNGNIYINPASAVLWNNCKFTSTASLAGSCIGADSRWYVCLWDYNGPAGNTRAMDITSCPYTFMGYSKFLGNGTANKAIWMKGGYHLITRGTVFDNFDRADGGILFGNSATCLFYSADSTGYNIVRNCALGIGAEYGAMVTYVRDVTFSGNTSDYSADAATFAIIDN